MVGRKEIWQSGDQVIGQLELDGSGLRFEDIGQLGDGVFSIRSVMRKERGRLMLEWSCLK